MGQGQHKLNKNTPSNKEENRLARLSYLNKGTSFSLNERTKYALLGALPSTIETLEQQGVRCIKYVMSRSTELEKYIALMNLKNTNIRLFFYIIDIHFKDLIPIIYTPTVGQACQEYSNIQPFLGGVGHDGMYISIEDIEENRLLTIFSNYQASLINQATMPSICVITDGSRILGLGDLGINGMGISVGKLALYIACGGIDPQNTIPITLDFGTNTQHYLDDENYMGIKSERPSDDKFYYLVDKFMTSFTEFFKGILVQFEDFSTDHAFGLLERYQNKHLCFNDDIQGTASVVVAGLINAMKISGKPSNEHKVLFFGAGSAAVGVALLVSQYMQAQCDTEENKEIAKKNIFLIDSQGLVSSDRTSLAEHKKHFISETHLNKDNKTLLETIRNIKPTILIGLSGIAKAFTDEIIELMSENNDTPIIFPLSNPRDNSECTFDQAMKHSKSKVIFASGTGFPKYTDPETNIEHYPGQGNNMYIFPGLGLAAILAKTKMISNNMVYTSALVLANSLSKDELDSKLLYPRVERIREISAIVCCGVMKAALAEGLIDDLEIKKYLEKDDEKILKYIKSYQWSPYPESLL